MFFLAADISFRGKRAVVDRPPRFGVRTRGIVTDAAAQNAALAPFQRDDRDLQQAWTTLTIERRAPTSCEKDF